MTKSDADKFWRIYGKAQFSNPPLDPSFEDLYQAIKSRLLDDLWVVPWHHDENNYGRIEDRS